MLKTVVLKLADIYVPMKRRKTRDADKVEAIAESIMEDGQRVPIQVRRDGERFILVNGYHRLEALDALGEDSVQAFIVREG